MSYEPCAVSDKTLINERNVKILRIKLGVGSATLVGGGALIGSLALPLLGFGSAGVAAGSFAASWQGPAVVSGSAFAICQSLGATGLGIVLFGAMGSATTGAGAIGMLYKYRSNIGWCSCDVLENSTLNAQSN